AISPDGQWIAGSTWNANSNIVRVWQVASGKPVAQWNSVNGSLLAFSPDSQRLIQSTLGGYQFRRVGTWEPEGEPLPATGTATGADARSMAYSADGRLLMLRSSAVAMRLIRSDTLDEVATFPPGSPVAFSRDGSRFASIGANQRVQVWDLAAIRRQLRHINLDWDDDADRPGADSPE